MRISDWSSDVCSSDLHRPVEQPLEHRGQQRHRREHDDADHDHEAERGQKVAVGEHLAVEQRVAPRQQVDQEHPQAGDGDAGFGPDLDAVEPVLLRSEEHTSELQSLMRISYAVFCLKKKKTNEYHETNLYNI